MNIPGTELPMLIGPYCTIPNKRTVCEQRVWGVLLFMNQVRVLKWHLKECSSIDINQVIAKYMKK